MTSTKLERSIRRVQTSFSQLKIFVKLCYSRNTHTLIRTILSLYKESNERNYQITLESNKYKLDMQELKYFEEIFFKFLYKNILGTPCEYVSLGDQNILNSP